MHYFIERFSKTNLGMSRQSNWCCICEWRWMFSWHTYKGNSLSDRTCNCWSIKKETQDPMTCVHLLSLQSCPTLCLPKDCSPLGLSVHGILQARILEWVAMSSSRGSSLSRDWTLISYVSCTGRWVLYHWATWEAPDPTTHDLKVTHFRSKGPKRIKLKIEKIFQVNSNQRENYGDYINIRQNRF